MLLQIMKMKMFKQCAERLVIGHLDWRYDSIYNFISCCSLMFLLLLVLRDHFLSLCSQAFLVALFVAHHCLCCLSLPWFLVTPFTSCHSFYCLSLPLFLVTLFVFRCSLCFSLLSLFFVTFCVSHYYLCVLLLYSFLVALFMIISRHSLYDNFFLPIVHYNLLLISCLYLIFA